MTTHKRVKFPFDVNKGKASDLYRLKFIRRSELEPNVRHFMKHSVGQMGRQLDVWFKEQIFTIGSLSKEQEKVFESGKRLKKELRRIKKEEYARYQEQVREKLLQIRRKLMLMKVVKKFKDNVEINRQYRIQEMGKRPNVDFLRVPGNEEYVFGSNSSNGNKSGKQTNKKDEHHQKKHKMLTSATALSDFNADSTHSAKATEIEETAGNANRNFLPKVKNKSKTWTSESDTTYSDDDYTEEHDNAQGTAPMAVLGQNFLPPASRMETIPEENVEEVEVEMDDLRAEDRKLTKKRLSLFNRSQAKRNIFDGSDKVPLLPDLSLDRPQLVSRAVPPETEDKQTQTSLESAGKGKSKSKHHKEHARIKKTIVVKLPGSSKHRSRNSKRDEDVKSSTGNYGSDPELDSDDINRDSNNEDSSSDVDGYTIEAEAIDSDGWEGSDEISDTSTDVSYYENLKISMSRRRHRTSAKTKKSKKSKDNTKTKDDLGDNKKKSEAPRYKTHFQIFPDDETFPENTSLIYRQNPRAVQYKERSFYVAPDLIVRPSGSAKYVSSRQLDGVTASSGEKTEPEKLKEIRNKRLDDMQRKLLNELHGLSPRINSSKSIHRTKEKTNLSTPPGSAKPDSRRSLSNSMGTVLQNQKRAQASEWRRAHDLANREPVQKYERTKSGRLLPFGSPRLAKHEIPSMKDQYYRDKLLKAERDTILNQNIKMKKFIDTFEKERVHADISALAGGPSGRAVHNSTDNTSSTIGNLLFKIWEPETDMEFRPKIIPSVSTTSLRVLKNCRYLREYMPVPEQDKNTSLCTKETSWTMDTRRSKYNENYVANVRLQLF